MLPHRLTASPLIEAAEMVDKLSSRDERTLKMATYTLQRLIREPPFTAEFIRRGGLAELVGLVQSQSSGNTLAYALTSCQNLLETSDDGVQGLDASFTGKVVRILVETERINVCRPATAILKKLVVAGPSSADAAQESGSTNANAGSFGAVLTQIRKEPAFLPTLVHRLGSADATLCLYSLSLLNSLMRHVTDALFDDFNNELEKLGTSAAVARLMESNRGEELASSILEYQNNVVRVLHRRLTTPVTPTDKRHVTALTYIWRQAKITEEAVAAEPPAAAPSNGRMTPSNSGSSLHRVGSGDLQQDAAAAVPATPAANTKKIKWRKLGFANENVARDFASTGWLGLECCDAYIRSSPTAYSQQILDELHRPEPKRCPWGRASTQVVEMLADHWGVTDEGYSTATRGFQPYLLFFQRVHYLALRFFLRMWNDSAAVAADFPRVAALCRSQVRYALRDEQGTSWDDLEKAFLEADYRAVRERQMKELELDDDYAAQPAIRSLRARLYRESYEFVRGQRLQCLLEGAWFRVPERTRFGSAMPPSSGGSGASAATQLGRRASSHLASTANSTSTGSRFATALGVSPSSSSNNNNAASSSSSYPAWRFYRLSPNRRHLHYCESNDPATTSSSLRSGLDDLPLRIDLAKVTDIALHSATSVVPLPAGTNGVGVNGSNGDAGSAGATPSTTNSFSLLGSPDSSLADLVAVSAAQYAEWVDGLSMLRGGGGGTPGSSSASVPPTPTTRTASASITTGLSSLAPPTPSHPPGTGNSSSSNSAGTGSSTVVHTSMTGEQIQALADIALKVKLLDLTGEKVELPSSVQTPPLPANLDFWFADI